jgi:hypothetical protein
MVGSMAAEWGQQVQISAFSKPNHPSQHHAINVLNP